MMTSNSLTQKVVNATADVTVNTSSDLRALTDKLRQEHDVIKNETGEWVLLRHADVLAMCVAWLAY